MMVSHLFPRQSTAVECRTQPSSSATTATKCSNIIKIWRKSIWSAAILADDVPNAIIVTTVTAAFASGNCYDYSNSIMPEYSNGQQQRTTARRTVPMSAANTIHHRNRTYSDVHGGETKTIVINIIGTRQIFSAAI